MARDVAHFGSRFPFLTRLGTQHIPSLDELFGTVLAMEDLITCFSQTPSMETELPTATDHKMPLMRAVHALLLAVAA